MDKTELKWFSVSFSYYGKELTSQEYWDVINKIAKALDTPITIDDLQIMEVNNGRMA